MCVCGCGVFVWFWVFSLLALFVFLTVSLCVFCCLSGFGVFILSSSNTGPESQAGLCLAGLAGAPA